MNAAFESALLLVAAISGVPLLFAAAAGLIVAILQTATQVQEASLNHLVKLSVAGAVIIFGGPWMLREFLLFTERTFLSLAGQGGGIGY